MSFCFQSSALGFLLAQKHFTNPLVAVPSAVSVVCMAVRVLSVYWLGSSFSCSCSCFFLISIYHSMNYFVGKPVYKTFMFFICYLPNSLVAVLLLSSGGTGRFPSMTKTISKNKIERRKKEDVVRVLDPC